MYLYSAVLRKVAPRFSLITPSHSLARSSKLSAGNFTCFRTSHSNHPSHLLGRVPALSNRIHRRTLAIMASVARPGQALCFPKSSRTLKALVESPQGTPITIECVSKSSFEEWLSSQPGTVSAWISATQFKGKDDELCIVPSPTGGVDRIILGVENQSDLWSFASLPKKLPPGVYTLSLSSPDHATSAALGFALGAYAFTRYKSKSDTDDTDKVQLVWPAGSDVATVTALAEAFTLARDMITTPAEDMGMSLAVLFVSLFCFVQSI